MSNATNTQARREQRRKQLFTNKSTHMVQKYLRRMRELGSMPDEMSPFFDVLDRVYVQGQDVRRPQGTKTVGTYCVQVPHELVYAAGAQPVKLCSGHYTAFSIGDDVVARDACPLVKAIAGFKHMGTLPVYENCSLMVVPTTCDCKKKIAGLLQEMCPVHILPIPANKEDEDVERFVEELYGLAHAISRVTGRAITCESLSDAVNRTGYAQRELSRFLNIKRHTINALYGTHAMVAMNAASYLDADAWAHAMCSLNDALERRARTNERVTHKDLPRIMITGSPIVFPNLKIPLLIEETGGIVVADETCMGQRGMSDPVVPTDSSFDGLMRALAIRALRPCPCPTFANNEQRLYRLRQMIRDLHVEGVVYHVLRGCLVYDYEYRLVEEELERLGIPVIRLESDYTDQDVEQLRIRTEAFVEMIKLKKGPLQAIRD
ncbi:MAG: 2-hydroxyacyl-CoA dehydratase family protein [Coriobacteriales bacterium]|nr:2-hydroxyacyl-CoA dehydratase family protein [Coriobacteriales bacterium]